MGTISQGKGFPNQYGGQTGKQIAAGFVTVNARGFEEASKKLLQAADALDASGKAGEDALRRALRKPSRMISDQYKSNVGDVTGNLKKSVKTKYVAYKSNSAVISVTGPRSTGTGSASERDGSGNHAWLVEFGTPRRKPGTQGRRTYVNVHQMINGKMQRSSSGVTDSQFANMGKGYYFLMGSIDEPTRQARAGSGYPHDFLPGEDGMRPMTLQSGESYGGMPAQKSMEKSLQQVGDNARAALLSSIREQTERFTD